MVEQGERTREIVEGRQLQVRVRVSVFLRQREDLREGGGGGGDGDAGLGGVRYPRWGGGVEMQRDGGPVRGLGFF